MITDSNQEINKRFDFSYEPLCEKTKQKLIDYERTLDLKLLLVDDRIVILDREKKLSDKEMAAFEWQNYLTYAGDKEALRIVFHDHCIFYHDHEKEKMEQALFLYERNKLLERLIKETHAFFPAFTIKSYHCSEYNVIFFLLNQQPAGTTNEDYAKMISCQLQSRAECVYSLSLRFRERFNSFVKADDVLREAKKEFKLVRTLLDQDHRLTIPLFIGWLKKLKATNGLMLPLDEKKLCDCFYSCLFDRQSASRLTPREFKKCMKDISEGHLPDCSFLYPVLVRYKGWLNDIILGLLKLHDLPELYYDRLFDRINKECIEQAKLRINAFEKEVPSNDMTADEYEKVIHKRIRKIKINSDQMKVADYYHYLEDIEMVKCCFITNCMESKDVDFHVEQFKNALLFDIEIRFLEHELIAIGKGIKAAVEDILEQNRSISLLIAHMVPNLHIMTRLKQAFEKALKAKQDRKPLIYVLQDLEDDFDFIFQEAEDGLFRLFDNHPYEERLGYALKKSRDISILEYKATTRGPNLHEFYGRLKRILDLQIEYLTCLPKACLPVLTLEETQQINENTEESFEDTQETMDDTPLTFDFQGNVIWLTTVFKNINKRYPFLDPRTSMESFVRIMTSKNLREEKEKVYLIGHTNIFKCILDAAKPHFNKLTKANVGRSELFISHLGNTLSEDNLKGSHLKKPDIIRDIYNFFSLKQD